MGSIPRWTRFFAFSNFNLFIFLDALNREKTIKNIYTNLNFDCFKTKNLIGNQQYGQSINQNKKIHYFLQSLGKIIFNFC